MKILSKICFIAFAVLASAVCPAYIPAYSVLLERLASLQGRRNYVIEQELIFKTNPSQAVFQEKWYIAKTGSMRLDVRPKNLNTSGFRILYHKNYKIFKDKNNKIQRKRISLYHLERPLHLRNADLLSKLIFQWKIAPLKEQEREEGQAEDAFVRLSRRQGVVQYEIGVNTGRLWIEQDEFVIREWLWPSGSRLTAWGYKFYPGGLAFPSQRRFQWSADEVLIRLVKVEQAGDLPKNLFNKKILNKQNLNFENLSYSDQDQAREFYQRFR